MTGSVARCVDHAEASHFVSVFQDLTDWARWPSPQALTKADDPIVRDSIEVIDRGCECSHAREVSRSEEKWEPLGSTTRYMSTFRYLLCTTRRPYARIS